ncbi:MAG: hypothetical protein KQH53_17710 [Desulfarculaceae bacterium]|nr:hypothetical protein [Desulfarculaceae bacterium]
MPFYLILDRIQIHNKFEWFSPAEVKIYSFANDGRLSLPELDTLKDAKEFADKQQIIREMGKTILAKWEGIKIENVETDHIFNFGDTGKIVASSDTLPETLDWTMLIVEDDEDIRDFGEMIDKILPDDKIDSLSSNLLKIFNKATNPQVTAAIAISKMLIRGVTAVLRENENDQMGLIEQSFVRRLHYPQGKKTGKGVPDLTGNTWYDYTIFGYEK